MAILFNLIGLIEGAIQVLSVALNVLHVLNSGPGMLRAV